MPVVKTITLYSFNELSEMAQNEAVDSLWDINVSNDWWDYIFSDAAGIGLKIEEFWLDRHIIRGELAEYLLDSCSLIRRNHGKECETFKTAANFHKTYIAAFVEWYDTQTQQSKSHHRPKDWLAQFKFEDEAQKIQADFEKALLEDYLELLRSSWDHLCSRQEIVKSIEANNCLFTELGEPA